MSTAVQNHHGHNTFRVGRPFATVATAMAVAGSLCACAANAPASPSAAPIAAPAAAPLAEDAVRALAAARWQALIAGDFARAYTYAAPSYRQLNSFEMFRGSKQGATIKWLSANPLNVSCEASVCAVKIEVESKPITPFPFKGTLKSALDERWVLEEGKWWIFEKL